MAMNRQQYERMLHLCDVLESGKYQKGKRQLRDGDTYCCLGVACDLSGLGEWHHQEGGTYYVGPWGNLEFAYLPEPVREYYGFPSTAGIETNMLVTAVIDLKVPERMLPYETRVNLVHLNDGGHNVEEKSHPEIAKIIREWLAKQEITEESGDV